tara:strand:- start:581 stop:754 length:174 start_codon:yes stop_codon:yes gene_type:complete
MIPKRKNITHRRRKSRNTTQVKKYPTAKIKKATETTMEEEQAAEPTPAASVWASWRL